MHHPKHACLVWHHFFAPVDQELDKFESEFVCLPFLGELYGDDPLARNSYSASLFCRHPPGCVFQSVLADAAVEAEDEIFLVAASRVSDTQQSNSGLPCCFNQSTSGKRGGPTRSMRKQKWLDSSILLQVTDETECLVFRGSRLAVLAPLQSHADAWYCRCLVHLGHSRTINVASQCLYWSGMDSTVRSCTRTCSWFQKAKRHKLQYVLVPTEQAVAVPWSAVCADLIGPCAASRKDSICLDSMCSATIDPAYGWCEATELPLSSVAYTEQGEETAGPTIGKSPAQISCLFLLLCCPRAKEIIFDSGSEFKLHFTVLCKSLGLKLKPASAENPQANSVSECIHQVTGSMLQTPALGMADTVAADGADQFSAGAAWAVHFLCHTVLKFVPGAAVFCRDMLFDIPHLADWKAVGQHREDLAAVNSLQENSKRVPFGCAV